MAPSHTEHKKVKKEEEDTQVQVKVIEGDHHARTHTTFSRDIIDSHANCFCPRDILLWRSLDSRSRERKVMKSARR